MKKIHRTIIIGAGPGGLNAARYLEEDCLIIEAKSNIGSQIKCGEGISIFALNRENIDIKKSWVSSQINQIQRIMPNGKIIGEKKSKPYALVLNKSKFQKYLAQQIKFQIKLNEIVIRIKRQNSLWRIKTNIGNNYFCKQLREIFKKKHTLCLGICYEIELNKKIKRNDLSMYFGSRIIPSGYAWTFPTSDFSANIGILSKINVDLRFYFNKFLKKNFANLKIIKNKGGGIPQSGFVNPIIKDNAFLVGDAGGFADPIFEGGINMALLTGRLAAESINLEKPELYQQKINSLPFTTKDLLKAQSIFYSLNDQELNDLGDLLHNRSTDYLKSKEGMGAFLSKEKLNNKKNEILEFFKIWQKAKDYLW